MKDAIKGCVNSCSPLLNSLFVNISSVKKIVVAAAQIKKQKSRRREEINKHQTVRHTVNQWQSLRPLVRPLSILQVTPCNVSISHVIQVVSPGNQWGQGSGSDSASQSHTSPSSPDFYSLECVDQEEDLHHRTRTCY